MVDGGRRRLQSASDNPPVAFRGQAGDVPRWGKSRLCDRSAGRGGNLAVGRVVDGGSGRNPQAPLGGRLGRLAIYEVGAGRGKHCVHNEGAGRRREVGGGGVVDGGRRRLHPPPTGSGRTHHPVSMVAQRSVAGLPNGRRQRDVDHQRRGNRNPPRPRKRRQQPKLELNRTFLTYRLFYLI